MKYGRVYNFSAGPAIMPEPVLEDGPGFLWNRDLKFLPLTVLNLLLPS